MVEAHSAECILKIARLADNLIQSEQDILQTISARSQTNEKTAPNARQRETSTRNLRHRNSHHSRITSHSGHSRAHSRNLRRRRPSRNRNLVEIRGNFLSMPKPHRSDITASQRRQTSLRRVQTLKHYTHLSSTRTRQHTQRSRRLTSLRIHRHMGLKILSDTRQASLRLNKRRLINTRLNINSSPQLPL